MYSTAKKTLVLFLISFIVTWLTCFYFGMQFSNHMSVLSDDFLDKIKDHCDPLIFSITQKDKSLFLSVDVTEVVIVYTVVSFIISSIMMLILVLIDVYFEIGKAIKNDFNDEEDNDQMEA